MIKHFILIAVGVIVFALIAILLNFIFSLVGAIGNLYLLFSIASAFLIVLIGVLYFDSL